ncbi:hypothetical protein [Chamaesiphon sp. OTE_8_metabat_110]|nr:hypothetical protein [Chamaesiphon sp. OTE_8_metabat_110]
MRTVLKKTFSSAVSQFYRKTRVDLLPISIELELEIENEMM